MYRKSTRSSFFPFIVQSGKCRAVKEKENNQSCIFQSDQYLRQEEKKRVLTGILFILVVVCATDLFSTLDRTVSFFRFARRGGGGEGNEIALGPVTEFQCVAGL